MDNYISIVIFCFVGAVTPGPNNIMLMTAGLNHGIKKSLSHYLGVIVGFPIMVIIIGSGLGAMFLTYPLFHKTIKIIGITYLIYLALKIANTKRPNANEELKKPFTFIQAAAFQWVNPKAWAMIEDRGQILNLERSRH